MVNLPTGNQPAHKNGVRKDNFSVLIQTELEALGIQLTSTLRKTMEAAHEETVVRAIEALKAALEKTISGVLVVGLKELLKVVGVKMKDARDKKRIRILKDLKSGMNKQ